MLVLALLLSFLVGAIPFGVLIGRSRGVNVRAVGSGNIGATNVWRALGPLFGSLAFVLDVGKGAAGPLLAHMLVADNDSTAQAVCGVVAVLGHTFSPFLGFKGGKGIATSLGAMLALMPLVGIVIFALWGVVLGATRMISAASVMGCVALPLLAWAFGAPTSHFFVAILMSLVAFVKHIPNLKRIRAGVEPKVGQAKITAPATTVPLEIEKLSR